MLLTFGCLAVLFPSSFLFPLGSLIGSVLSGEKRKWLFLVIEGSLSVHGLSALAAAQ